MKSKGLFVLLGIILGLIFFGGIVSAEEGFGGEEIMEALPDGVKEYMDKQEVSAEDGSVASLTAEDVFEEIWRYLCEGIQSPLKMLAGLVGIIFLCALVGALRDSAGNSSLTETFRVVGVLAGAGLLCNYMGEIVEAARSGMAAFLLSYVPAFAGVMAVNGQTGAAASYNSLVIVASEMFSQATSLFLFPAVSSILGISVAASINPDLNISGIAEGVKKLVTWALGLMMAVFTGLLSVQSFVAASSDSLSLRAAKFTVSNSVPVIGGAVSDALSTVGGSLSLIKNSMGGFGVIAAAGIILPALITVSCFRFALMAAGAAGRLFGTDRLCVLLKSGESVLDMIIAMLVCFGLLIIISTAMMLALGGMGANA